MGSGCGTAPPWITTQQAAELWGALLAEVTMCVWGGGEGNTLKWQQQRVLRCLVHRQGLHLTLGYVPSHVDPADAVSRAQDGSA